MSIDSRLTTAACVAGGLAVGAGLAYALWRVMQERCEDDQSHPVVKTDLHEWEGEGGNLAPRHVVNAQPG